MPEPGSGELRIRVLACGVAYADLMLREGLYPIKTGWPRVPGYDVVGEIEAVGPDCPAPWACGQRVAALTVLGSYARHRRLPHHWCIALPPQLDPLRAAAIGLNYLTALQMLRRAAMLEAGDSVLVHAAAGGVGSAVLDLAKLLQLRVLGTVSAGKMDYVRRHGGEPIDYRSEDVEARVRQLTGGAGVDAVLDSIGGAEIRRSYRLLKPTGSVISYGALTLADQGRLSIGGALAAVLNGPRYSALRLFQESRGVYGFNVQSWRDHRPRAYRQDFAQLFDWLEQGKIDPQIAEVLPLQRAEDAQRKLGSGKIIGKLLLDCTA